jgi:hypothetical protein
MIRIKRKAGTTLVYQAQVGKICPLWPEDIQPSSSVEKTLREPLHPPSTPPRLSLTGLSTSHFSYRSKVESCFM